VGIPDDYRAESRKRWGGAAAGWEARRDFQRTLSMPVSAWLIDAVDPQPGDVILELAAGVGDTGFLAAELVAPGGELISSDFAPEMLSAAQRRAEELGIENVRFKQIDAETSIDLEAASVDGVLCRWSYMLMAEPEAALRETRRVLKPGRRVALAAWTGPEDNPWSVLPWRALVEHGLAEQTDPAVPNQFTWAEEGRIAGHLEAAGFTEYHVETVEFSMDYLSAADWWDSQSDCSGRFAAVVRQGPQDRVAVARAAVEREAEQFATGDRGVRIPARTWVAWAAA
jgi:ubiquinone/menaquinone biosynthesis C-methylase UbiE